MSCANVKEVAERVLEHEHAPVLGLVGCMLLADDIWREVQAAHAEMAEHAESLARELSGVPAPAETEAPSAVFGE